MVKCERINEPTPNGGAYSEIHYLDADGNSVEVSEAVHCVIRECLEDGSLICETWGTV